MSEVVPAGTRTVDRRRWRRDIARHLDDFPRQYSALEHAMAAFGGSFDLQRFKEAFDTVDDMDAYNRVQAVERALGRVQNFVADLAQAGVKLAQLPHVPDGHGPPAEQAFAALREAGVIDGELCRRLTRAQNARSMIEHSYIQTPAGNVHQAAELVRESARDFIGRYREWVEPHLKDSANQSR
ncbi:MAG TPA: hypothetical protein VK272_03605 [Solirubrobacteraceae bacterium]|nr:hypothetical protein [Solirubrobacteraceae bacterium]